LGDKQTAHDMLVYEIPPDVNRDAIKYYRLELPAAAIGGVGWFRFQIPASMVSEI
jgi:hypothetical protein